MLRGRPSGWRKGGLEREIPGVNPNPTCSVVAGSLSGSVAIAASAASGAIAGSVTFDVTATVVDSNQKKVYQVGLPSTGNTIQVKCN